MGPVFDSSGVHLPFAELSDGEREIAFLVGQIERFKLRRGLLLIDEPELHLNPDLLRTWLQFARNTIIDGQVWVATHSIEAAEVAAPRNTYVLERDPESGKSTATQSLSGKPVLLALSAAVGSPAFAIHKRRFIYIEGEPLGQERQRFYDLVGDLDANRFLGGGGCRDVIRMVGELKLLAAEDEQIQLGGVIDRDLRTDEERTGATG
jgi:hypothetical protein